MVVETSGKPSLPITGKTDDSMEGSTQVAVSAKVRALELEYMTLLEKRIADLKDGLQGDSASSKATSDDKLPDGPAKVPEESSTKAQVPSLSTKDSARETENGSSQEAQIESSEKQNDKDGENMAELKSRFRFIQEDEHGVEQETDTSLTLEKSLEQNAGSSVGKAAEVRRIMVENKVGSYYLCSTSESLAVASPKQCSKCILSNFLPTSSKARSKLNHRYSGVR